MSEALAERRDGDFVDVLAFDLKSATTSIGMAPLGGLAGCQCGSLRKKSKGAA